MSRDDGRGGGPRLPRRVETRAVTSRGKNFTGTPGDPADRAGRSGRHQRHGGGYLYRGVGCGPHSQRSGEPRATRRSRSSRPGGGGTSAMCSPPESVSSFEAQRARFHAGEKLGRAIELKHADTSQARVPRPLLVHRIGPDGAEFSWLGRDLRPSPRCNSNSSARRWRSNGGLRGQSREDTRFRMLMEAMREPVVFLTVATGSGAEAQRRRGRTSRRQPERACPVADFSGEFEGRKRDGLVDALAPRRCRSAEPVGDRHPAPPRRTVALSPRVFRAGGERTLLCRIEIAEGAEIGSDEDDRGPLGVLSGGCRRHRLHRQVGGDRGGQRGLPEPRRFAAPDQGARALAWEISSPGAAWTSRFLPRTRCARAGCGFTGRSFSPNFGRRVAGRTVRHLPQRQGAPVDRLRHPRRQPRRIRAPGTGRGPGGRDAQRHGTGRFGDAEGHRQRDDRRRGRRCASRRRWN